MLNKPSARGKLWLNNGKNDSRKFKNHIQSDEVIFD